MTGQSEIDNDRDAGLVNEYVGRFQIAMQHAVLSNRKLFAVNLQAPTERREIHDFGDGPNFGDLTVSADGSCGWLESNTVQRRQRETSECKGSDFDPSYSDDGSTFVWSSWDKDGN